MLQRIFLSHITLLTLASLLSMYNPLFSVNDTILSEIPFLSVPFEANTRLCGNIAISPCGNFVYFATHYEPGLSSSFSLWTSDFSWLISATNNPKLNKLDFTNKLRCDNRKVNRTAYGVYMGKNGFPLHIAPQARCSVIDPAVDFKTLTLEPNFFLVNPTEISFLSTKAFTIQNNANYAVAVCYRNTDYEHVVFTKVDFNGPTPQIHEFHELPYDIKNASSEFTCCITADGGHILVLQTDANHSIINSSMLYVFDGHTCQLLKKCTFSCYSELQASPTDPHLFVAMDLLTCRMYQLAPANNQTALSIEVRWTKRPSLQERNKLWPMTDAREHYKALAWHPSGKYIILSQLIKPFEDKVGTGKLHIIDAHTGNCIRTIETTFPAEKIAISPDGTYFITYPWQISSGLKGNNQLDFWLFDPILSLRGQALKSLMSVLKDLEVEVEFPREDPEVLDLLAHGIYGLKPAVLAQAMKKSFRDIGLAIPDTLKLPEEEAS